MNKKLLNVLTKWNLTESPIITSVQSLKDSFIKLPWCLLHTFQVAINFWVKSLWKVYEYYSFYSFLCRWFFHVLCHFQGRLVSFMVSFWVFTDSEEIFVVLKLWNYLKMTLSKILNIYVWQCLCSKKLKFTFVVWLTTYGSYKQAEFFMFQNIGCGVSNQSLCLLYQWVYSAYHCSWMLVLNLFQNDKFCLVSYFPSFPLPFYDDLSLLFWDG